jgi:hypothetical protein
METETQQTPARLITADNLRIYMTVKNRDERSRMEDSLVLDRFNIGSYMLITKTNEPHPDKPHRGTK